MNALRETILVVDDDPDIRKILADRLETLGYQVTTGKDGLDALQKVNQEEPDLMFLDLQLPRMSGIAVLKKLKGQIDFPVIVITAFGTIGKAVEAMQEGAADFITKPFSSDHLELVLRKALDSRALKREKNYLQEALESPYLDVIGESPAIKKSVEIARTVAATPSTVLLLGESGTGKELFARSIHRFSPRAGKPFVVINCVALRDELLESELFGHEKGAFTGAHQLKRGKLEIANGGTVFLDEIGDFKPELQAKLLRVLQERVFERVGGTKEIPVDIRIVAATHRNLPKEVQAGRFREDLFFRLNVVTLILPPLRERSEDIPMLAAHFLRRACHVLKKPPITLSDCAIKRMRAYDWPGNIRELSNIIERAVVLTQGNELVADDLFLSPPSLSSDNATTKKSYYDQVRSFQRELLRQTLQRSGGSQAKAAEQLCLQRTYLARLIKKLKVQ